MTPSSTDSGNNDSTISIEDNKTKARTQIVTVVVEEKTEVTMEDEAASNVMMIVPIVVAVVLVVVAIAIIIRCFQSRKKTLDAIQNNLK